MIFWATASRVGVAAPSALERYKSQLVREPHDPDGLGVEPLAMEVGPDRHMHPRYRRERYRTLSHRRLGQSRCR